MGRRGAINRGRRSAPIEGACRALGHLPGTPSADSPAASVQVPGTAPRVRQESAWHPALGHVAGTSHPGPVTCLAPVPEECLAAFRTSGWHLSAGGKSGAEKGFAASARARSHAWHLPPKRAWHPPWAGPVTCLAPVPEECLTAFRTSGWHLLHRRPSTRRAWGLSRCWSSAWHLSEAPFREQEGGGPESAWHLSRGCPSWGGGRVSGRCLRPMPAPPLRLASPVFPSLTSPESGAFRR